MQPYCSKKRIAQRIEESCHVQAGWEQNKLRDAFPMIADWGCFVVALLLDHNYTQPLFLRNHLQQQGIYRRV